MRMQKQLDKLEKDTYAVRKAEGRPKHGQTSLTVLGVGSLAWFLVIIALVLPEWRATWLGMVGYPHKRSWGLFSVVGMSSKMHHEAMTDACRFFSQLNVGGICASPVCLWYNQKCQIYMDVAMINYVAAFFFFVCLILHTLCLVWTMRMTPRMIKWAAIWWVAQIIIHISVLVFWWVMLSESFGSLDTHSMYPEPDFSFCFYIECLAIICLGVCAMMGVTLMKMWPESSESGSDETTESDEGSDEAEQVPPHGKGMQGGPPAGWQPGMGQPPPGMMGPPMMGGPPQGMNPQMMGPQGGNPQMMGGPPQQGWNPGMGPPPQGQGMPPAQQW